MHRFSYGHTITRGHRQARVLRIGLLIVVLAAVFGGALGFLIGVLTGDLDSPLPAVLAVLCMAGLFSVVLVRFRAVDRRAAWLDGSVLTIRDPQPRSIDLAAAERVRFTQTQTHWREPPAGLVGPEADFVPAVEVTARGETLRMRLSDADRTPLPKADLQALAAALAPLDVPGATQAVANLERLAAVIRR